MPEPPTTVVLLHGFASSFDHGWRQTGWVDILADFGCKVPEIDLPGHGSSPRLLDPRAYDDVEAQLFRALPPETPVPAVGFSAGADLVLRLAIGHPGRFDRIVLLGLSDHVFESGDASRARWCTRERRRARRRTGPPVPPSGPLDRQRSAVTVRLPP